MIPKLGNGKTARLLNIGCGMRFHTDWVNIDSFPGDKSILRHDITRGLPFADQSFDAVYHSHVLEHMDRIQAPRLIQECHRVLKKGGILRVVVPNLEKIAELYLKYLQECRQGITGAALKAEWMRIELLDQLCRQKSGGEYPRFLTTNKGNLDFPRFRCGNWVDDVNEVPARRERVQQSLEKIPIIGTYLKALRVGLFRIRGEVHLWMYDELSLIELCAKEGFKDGVVTTAFESKIPGWADYLLDSESSGKIYKPDSLFLEFTRI